MSSSSKASFISGAFHGVAAARGGQAALIAAVACALLPAQADSAGVHENAAAEAAFLLAPQAVVLRASLETARSESRDASLYRFYAAFPARSAFLVAFEQPLVSVSDSLDLDSGFGDLMIRTRGRIFGKTRVLWFNGFLGCGTGEKRLFPYSSESIDIGAALAVTDSLGPIDLFALGGYVWAQRIPDELDGLHDDHVRLSAGAGCRVGERASVRGGVVRLDYERLDARRDILFGAAAFRWTESLRFFAEGERETGPVAERASDWAVTLGAAVHF